MQPVISELSTLSPNRPLFYLYIACGDKYCGLAPEETLRHLYPRTMLPIVILTGVEQCTEDLRREAAGAMPTSASPTMRPSGSGLFAHS